MPDSPAPTTEADVPAAASVAPSGNGGGPGPDSAGGGVNYPRRVALGVVLVLVVVGIAFLIAFFAAVQHWAAVHSGTDLLMCKGAPCPQQLYYNFWSGFGSDIGEATLLSAVSIGVYTGVRKVNCHTKGCWRIGHHPLDGTPYILCRHHHPHVPTGGATHQHILEQHRIFKDAQAARDNKGI